METKIYSVKRIDGDYAYLIWVEQPELGEKCVARALLPEQIFEGCLVKSEFMQYEMYME